MYVLIFVIKNITTSYAIVHKVSTPDAGLPHVLISFCSMKAFSKIS